MITRINKIGRIIVGVIFITTFSFTISVPQLGASLVLIELQDHP